MTSFKLFSSLSTRRRTAALIVVLLLVGTLAFIFTNSAFPQDDSAEQSRSFGELIRFLLDPARQMGDEAYDHLVRKLAHFTEFALLGALVSLLWFVLRRFPLPLRLFVTLGASVCDESIQILSKRGSLVNDVLLDFSGSLCGMLLSVLVCYLIFRAKRWAMPYRKRISNPQRVVASPTNGRRFAALLLCVIIIVTMAFIFSNSLKTADVSQRQSVEFGEVTGIIDPGTANAAQNQNVITMLRKMAHFIEFFLLGAELMLLTRLVSRPRVQSLFFFTLASAVCDESLQIFSDRTSSVRDVLLDFSGALCGMAVMWLLSAAVIFALHKLNNHNAKSGV